MTSDVAAARAARRTVLQDGRAKAYRPMPATARRLAFAAGLAAYRRGDFFEAHELLEPAWMGTDDPAERDLYQGLIKLAAAYVHDVRGNPVGLAKNLLGARRRLSAAGDSSRAETPTSGRAPRRRAETLDLPAIVRAIDERLAELEAGSASVRLGPPAI